jgi:uncharacterized protein with HEPN domain
MSRRETGVTLRQMLDHIDGATAPAGARTRTDVESDRTLLLALIKPVEIVGEAARRLPGAVRSQAHQTILSPRSQAPRRTLTRRG